MRDVCVRECDKTFCSVCSVLPREMKISWGEERTVEPQTACSLSLLLPTSTFLFPAKGAKMSFKFIFGCSCFGKSCFVVYLGIIF